MLICPQQKYALVLSKKSIEGTRVDLRKKLRKKVTVKERKKEKKEPQ